jgi:transposase InsO family protein
MRENDIRARTKRKFRVTTDSRHDHPVAPNLLDRQFTVEAPNTVWLADLSYIWTREGWLYPAVVLDLFSRQVVGWAMDEQMPRELTLAALDMAVELRLGEIRRCLAKDLVRLAQPPDLALQRFDPLPVVACRTGPLALVALGLPDPAPQRLGSAADLRRDRADRRPLRGVLPGVFEHHPHRALADFRGVFG